VAEVTRVRCPGSEAGGAEVGWKGPEGGEGWEGEARVGVPRGGVLWFLCSPATGSL
jgi:hypothetical protein